MISRFNFFTAEWTDSERRNSTFEQNGFSCTPAINTGTTGQVKMIESQLLKGYKQFFEK